MWQLELGDEVIARLTEVSCEFPWTHATLIDASKFARFRAYFADDATWPDTQEFADLCSEIRAKGRFALRNLATNQTYHNVTLNHEGAHVWFRYS